MDLYGGGVSLLGRCVPNVPARVGCGKLRGVVEGGENAV